MAFISWTEYDRKVESVHDRPIIRAFADTQPAAYTCKGAGSKLMSRVYIKQARNQEVVDEYLRIGSMRGTSESEVEDLRAAFRRDGLPAFWRSWLAFDLRHSGSNPDPVRVANFHVLAGDTAQALLWLERASAERNPALIYIFADPNFAALHEHPRFRRIFQQMKFSAL